MTSAKIRIVNRKNKPINILLTTKIGYAPN
jgi:hypothetical protein